MNFTKSLTVCLLFVLLLFAVVNVDAKNKKKKKKVTIKKIENSNFGTATTIIPKRPNVVKEENVNDKLDDKRRHQVVPANILAKLQNIGNNLTAFVQEFKPPGMVLEGNILKDLTNNVQGNTIRFQNPSTVACKPRQRVKQIPFKANVLFWPPCYTVKRCGGCCEVYNRECIAEETRNETISVFQLSLSQNVPLPRHRLIVEQHTKCKCACRIRPQDCSEGQTFNAYACQCECRRSPPPTCGINKSWSHQKCGCTCIKKNCVKNKYWDEKQCACVCNKTACKNKKKNLNTDTCKCV